MTKVLPGFLLLHFLLFGCSSKSEEKKQATSENQETVQTRADEYPELVLTFEDGETVSTKKLEGNNVFIFFQPDCKHCQVEAIDIEQRLEEFKNYTLYFISSSTMESIKAFAESLDLDNKDNVKFAWTSTESVLNHYGPIQTPSVYIYSNGKLKESFNGQTDIENILGAL